MQKDRKTATSYKAVVQKMFPDARIEHKGGPGGFRYVVCLETADTYETVSAAVGINKSTKEAWKYASLIDAPKRAALAKAVA